MSTERLQKVLAHRGLASRREAETWILGGRVSVNGQVVTELGTRVDPTADQVAVDGAPIPRERTPVVILLNKPAGCVTTVRDPHAEHTVMELVAGVGRRVYPVGRLDKDTRGVLVLTDDGDLAHALLHPSRGVEKVYEVTASGDFGEDSLERLAAGVALEDGHVTRPVRVFRVRKTASGVRFRMTLKEGHKRQVRQMVRAVGGHVMELVRVSFGGLTAEDLPEGAWRVLKKVEIESLRAASAKPEAGVKRRPPRRAGTKGEGRGAKSRTRAGASGKSARARSGPKPGTPADRKAKTGAARSDRGRRR